MKKSKEQIWPELALNAWRDTYDTLHMWTQVVGKIRLTLSPAVNHWWHSALYVTPRGLSTSLIPYAGMGFSIEFDFIDHLLAVRTTDGVIKTIRLEPKTTAKFYRELMETMNALGISLQIHTLPNEVPDPIRFEDDERHRSYDSAAVHRFWKILLQSDRLMKRFRGEFIGKCSPVHFFWGSFDLACSRFSGRKAPERPGVDAITREAYSHELISCGFWPGSGNIQEAAFYVYAAPEPEGFNQGKIYPEQAFYNAPTRGFVLRYEDVRNSADPDAMLLDFFKSAYDLAADLGKWDRTSLERNPPIRIKAA